MHDDIDVVEQDLTAVALAFDVPGPHPQALAELLADVIGDRAHLDRGAAGGEQEIVATNRESTDVEEDNVGCLLFEGKLSGQADTLLSWGLRLLLKPTRVQPPLRDAPTDLPATRVES